MSEQQENRDYDHKQSVRDCASIANHQTEENPKPHQGTEPFPVWLLIICVIILIVGGSYVGANSGGFEFANNNKSEFERTSNFEKLTINYIYRGVEYFKSKLKNQKKLFNF